MEKKKLLIFSGAGVSKESGVETFRDGQNALWENVKIEDVATPNAWRKDREKVLDFYNKRRAQLKTVEPNEAHLIIAQLETLFNVTVVTQNVDNLHERAGSTNVVHLHGELTKVRSSLNSSLVYDTDKDTLIGDKCEKGSQLRPHIVWFGEGLNEKDTDKAINAARECDVCIIIGTSMLVSPANEILFHTKPNTPIYCVDPGELGFEIPTYVQKVFQHIQLPATVGMQFMLDVLETMD
jgi:NAD-dependent deacetylase